MVVGSSPAVLIILTKWSITPTKLNQPIKFQWILLYKLLYTNIVSNTTYLNNSFLFSLKIRLFQKSINRESTDLTILNKINKPQLNRNINYKTYFKTPRTLETRLLHVNFTKRTPFYNLFLLYIQHTHLSKMTFFTPHPNFQAFFIFANGKTNGYVNVLKVYSHWNHITNFILNLFFIDISTSIFTVKTLKNEALSFNWTQMHLNYNLFTNASPLFFLKETVFGINTTLVFKKLHQRFLRTAFITDIKYHEKNIYYFNRLNMTTIGLVSHNLNPWLVTYALPTSNSSLFIQHFFIKLLLYYKQYSLQSQFTSLHKLW